MDNRGQITVFLSLLTLTMLVLGMSAVEIVRIKTGDAKAVIATAGAADDVKAAYNRSLFDEYHILAIDKEFGGQGEAKIEEMAQGYLEYTLDTGREDSMVVNQVALSDYEGVLDDECAEMKEQITDYMKTRSVVDAAEELIEKVTSESDARSSTKSAIEKGKTEENDDSSSWTGKDPRKVLKSCTSGGLLSFVTPDGTVPSKDEIDKSGLPSEKCGADSSDSDSDFFDMDFDDVDEMENKIDTDTVDESKLRDNFYGISYALEFFDKYTDAGDGSPLACEVEYIICGHDNDYDNLKGVVDRIILHRLPVNFAYLMTDKAKIASVQSVALTLSLLPGVSYSATKYLLLGCWAYAETLVDIKVLLAGGSVKFLKSKDTWHTDIKGLKNLGKIEAKSYEGADALDYSGYLAILLAENTGGMYYRIADLIQLDLIQTDSTFAMENMIYEFSIDVEISKKRKYASFVESAVKGLAVPESSYIYSHSITAGY